MNSARPLLVVCFSSIELFTIVIVKLSFSNWNIPINAGKLVALKNELVCPTQFLGFFSGRHKDKFYVLAFSI